MAEEKTNQTFIDFKVPDTTDVIATLSNRPNASKEYGGDALSADDLKKRFDALPTAIKEKFNALIGYISEGSSFAGDIKVDNTSFETLADLVKAISTGTFAANLNILDELNAPKTLQSFYSELTKTISEISGEIENTKETIPLIVDEVLDLTKANVNHDKIIEGYTNSIDAISLNKKPEVGEKFWCLIKSADNYLFTAVAKITDTINPEGNYPFELTEAIIIYDPSTLRSDDIPNGNLVKWDANNNKLVDSRFSFDFLPNYISSLKDIPTDAFFGVGFFEDASNGGIIPYSYGNAVGWHLWHTDFGASTVKNIPRGQGIYWHQKICNGKREKQTVTLKDAIVYNLQVPPGTHWQRFVSVFSKGVLDVIVEGEDLKIVVDSFSSILVQCRNTTGYSQFYIT